MQSRRGESLPLRRSGGVEVEIIGNYNTLGWMVSLDPREWWKASNLSGVKNDLYSIVRHEMGHALRFNPAHPGFARRLAGGKLASPLALDRGMPIEVELVRPDVGDAASDAGLAPEGLALDRGHILAATAAGGQHDRRGEQSNRQDPRQDRAPVHSTETLVSIGAT